MDVAHKRFAAPIPARAGIGLRAEHYREVVATRPPVGWFEVHSENYFGDGGAPHHYLEQVRRDYPLSLHGVGLSLGSADALNRAHLEKLKALIQHYEPGLVSDHLSWSSVDGRYLNDLLPLPYTGESLRHVAERVSEAQDFLGREILIENPSSYLQYQHSDRGEAEFLAELAARSGCGILLDVNNIYVSASNHGYDAETYLRAIPPARVREIHLAGHTVNRYPEGEAVDTHNARVCDAVWTLYGEALQRVGPVPVLIEWDTDLPSLSVLLDEARKAEAIQSHNFAGSKIGRA
ncbi:MAG: DUF692 domain-containing protein [Gammaproteobacteria bacterium]|nr:DUF692 domain-containing protein [Gammaproteobacteria bacterium]